LDAVLNRNEIIDRFTNGTTSISESMLIILSILSRFDISYITSIHAENVLNSLAPILDKDGYQTLFFYGGKSNSCYFGSLRSEAQFDEYHCQNDYNDSSSDMSD
jgi:phosphoglycerol transferase MdoB-like AlkP superfamily enzyme